MIDERYIPVIIGVGQVLDRTADDSALDSRGLMRQALLRAQADAGADVLNRLDWLGVEDQISFPDGAIAEHVAADLPAAPTTIFRTHYASGSGPTEMMNAAANLIGGGEARIAAIVGGEALRTAARLAREGRMPTIGGENRVRAVAESFTTPLARAYGLTAPTDVYPLYENATRAAWGMSVAEAQAESAALWAGMSRVAAGNPDAWITTASTSEQVAAISAENRLVSFPYPKLMVANSAVNMGAAVLIASLAIARELGLDEQRLIYLGRGAGAHEPDDYLRRDAYDHSASLTAVIAATVERNALDVAALDAVELYSCFPCVPKMARRALGWPAERPISAYGGLTFGGGPIGNCMTHAAAAMTLRLRNSRGTGLIVANGGYATTNHALVLTATPQPSELFPQEVSVQADADARRRPVPKLIETYSGPGTIETFAVPYRGGAPAYGVVIARTPAEERFVSHVPPSDAATLAFLTNDRREPVGAPGIASGMLDGRIRWESR